MTSDSQPPPPLVVNEGKQETATVAPDDTAMIIDIRERDLITAMGDRAGVRVEALDLGDVVLRRRGATLLTIERKTLADLAASIRDGRYREQKLRLQHTVNSACVMYVVEGVRGGPSRDVLLGMLVNTMLRDNMKTCQTPSLQGTVDVLERMRVHLIDKPAAESDEYFASLAASARTPPFAVARAATGGDGAAVDVSGAYAATIKRVKKDNLDVATCMTSQLAQVPGVSASMASTIASAYGCNMATLCDALRADDGERRLADVQWTTPSKRQRRVGPAIASRVRAYLLNGGSTAVTDDAPKAKKRQKSASDTKPRAPKRSKKSDSSSKSSKAKGDDGDDKGAAKEEKAGGDAPKPAPVLTTCPM